MFDYQKSKFWNEYIASLDSEKDSGLGGFCEYLSQRLEAVEHSVQATALESPAKKSVFTAEVFRPAKKRKVTSRA